MIEKKKIEEKDLEVIKVMSGELERLAAAHSKIRREFITIENGILHRIGVADREFKTFFVELAKLMGISEEDAREWSLDMEDGCFFRTLPDSNADPVEESVVEVVEPTLSRYEQIRQKYGAK